MTRKEVLDKFVAELKLVDKTFKSYEAKASALLAFVENDLEMTPPQPKPMWDRDEDSMP